jgi:hypothetical protein
MPLAKYVAQNRDAARQKLEKFLTPDQLKTWDAEVAKAKDFFSQRAAAAEEARKIPFATEQPLRIARRRS